MEQAILLEKNEFSKTYKIGMIDLYVAKAYDDEKDKHFVICSIPQIPHLDIVKLQMPFEFDFEGQRDMFFEGFDADEFMKAIYRKIEENRKLSKEQNGEN